MRAVGVVGARGAGKTTLVERLVPVLRDRGRVATVKSIHHDVEIDEAGTDTHRHRTAGAEEVVGVTPSLTFAVESRGKDDADDEAGALDRLLRRLEGKGFDYVLVEGFTGSALPKLVVGDGQPDARAGDVVRRIVDSESVDVEAVADDLRTLEAWSPTDRSRTGD